jgi:NAD+--asparagine ADP-ribosyltransferase
MNVIESNITNKEKKNDKNFSILNKKIKAIKQQTFFNILKQFNIVITDEEQNQFFERFKIEDINDISEELMNFEEIINWYEL